MSAVCILLHTYGVQRGGNWHFLPILNAYGIDFGIFLFESMQIFNSREVKDVAGVALSKSGANYDGCIENGIEYPAEIRNLPPLHIIYESKKMFSGLQ
jgi:hypothetical protein